MAMRDKIEHAIQNQPCTVKDLKSKFGGDRGSDRKVMEAVDQLVHEAVICQRQGVFFTVRSGRADKALLCKVVKLGKNLPCHAGGRHQRYLYPGPFYPRCHARRHGACGKV